MAGEYLGGSTVGGTVVGLSEAFSAVGEALTDLHGTVDVQMSLIEDQAAAILTAKAAIRIPATADFQAQLDASLALDAQLGLSISDPTAYLTGLLNGLAQVNIDVAGLVPAVALDAQVAANAAVGADASLKIAAVDVELAALIAINLAIDGIRASLQVAIDAVTAALDAYVEMVAQLGTAGAHAVLYDGPLASLGAEVDLVTPDSGVGGGVNVRCIVVFVESSDSEATGAFNAVFRTS